MIFKTFWLLVSILIVDKLVGVGPVNNRPSTDLLKHFVKNKTKTKNPAYGFLFYDSKHQLKPGGEKNIFSQRMSQSVSQ